MNTEVAERLLIYHAGTGRITFLAMVKVTTLFLGAFFTFIVVPGYVKAEKPEWETLGGEFDLISFRFFPISPSEDIRDC
jgi:hypothetical protein